MEENEGQWSLVQILRSENTADTLAKSIVKNGSVFQNLKLKKELSNPSIEENEVLATCEIAESMKPITEYLNSGRLPDDKGQAKKIRTKAAQYLL